MAEQGEERQRERAAILRRRAQLMACAVVAGVALPECARNCLSIAEPNAGGTAATLGGAGAGTTACLSAGVPGLENAGQGGQAFCLTIAEAGASGETGAAGTPGAAGAAPTAAGAGGEGGHTQ